MNPYRCETCKKPHLVPDGLSRYPHFFCCDQEMPSDTATSTEIRGCASHSNFKSDREKMLDELIKWMLEQTNIVGSYGRVVKARYKEEIFERIFDKITELREGGGL